MNLLDMDGRVGMDFGVYGLPETYLVDREGVDVIAELWSHADPDSLPGILWRLYLLRTWMRKNRESIARLWRVG